MTLEQLRNIIRDASPHLRALFDPQSTTEQRVQAFIEVGRAVATTTPSAIDDFGLDVIQGLQDAGVIVVIIESLQRVTTRPVFGSSEITETASYSAAEDEVRAVVLEVQSEHISSDGLEAAPININQIVQVVMVLLELWKIVRPKRQ